MNKLIYVATIDIIHGDIYEQQDDGTSIVGVFDNYEQAKAKLIREYNRDKQDFANGSCRPDGNYEITEDNPFEDLGVIGTDHYRGSASVMVCEKKDGSFDKQITYTLEAHYLNYTNDL